MQTSQFVWQAVQFPVVVGVRKVPETQNSQLGSQAVGVHFPFARSNPE